MHKKRLEGISAPLLTPYGRDGAIDYEEYGRLTEYVTANGVDGIFVGGTSGEFVNQTLEERERLLEQAVKHSLEDTTVLFNITAMNVRDLKHLADCARGSGAAAVSVTAPYYHRYDRAALLEYFIRISDTVKDMDIYLYNMPGMTNNPLTAQLLKEIVDHCPNVRGIKDSSMDFMTILEYQIHISDRDFEIITGNDAQVLAALNAGAAGGLIAVASVFPRLASDIWMYFKAGEPVKARQAQDKVLLLRELFRGIMPVMAHKEALNLQGFHMGEGRFPFRSLNSGEKQRIKERLRELELIEK